MHKNSTIKRILSISLIVIGILLIGTAVALEVSKYPWRTLVDMERQADEIPDPTPIVLKKEDAGIALVEADEDNAPSLDELYDLLPGSELDDEPPEAYILLGIMKIPKLEVSQYILEGAYGQMKYGGGHIIGTAGIGEKGNCAIAAHRPQAFRHLDLLDEGDTVVLKANENIYTYSVYKSMVVEPTALWALDPVADRDYVITMITCTPYMVSTHRLVVWAELTDINGQAPEEFYAEAG